MDYEQHVITYERAKELQEAGIKARSMLVWAGKEKNFVTIYSRALKEYQLPAYTVTEMLAIINGPVKMEVTEKGACIAGNFATGKLYGNNHLPTAVSAILLDMAKNGKL